MHDDIIIKIQTVNGKPFKGSLTMTEARDRILARMKEDNNSISNMEKRTKEVKKNIDIYEKKIRDLEAIL